MVRRFYIQYLPLLIGLWVALLAQAQSVPPVGKESSEDGVDSEHLQQLETCRAGLLDPEARDEERRRLAFLLLSYDTQAAEKLVVELLRRTDRPDVQRTLCRTIGDKARGEPPRINESLAEPILDLLGAEAGELRTAAARTLAEFPGTSVPNRLGEIAANPDQPLPKRLAAVDALAPNTHRRAVVGQLIPLLKAGEPQVVERTLSALAPAAQGGFGPDIQRWSAWWDVRSRWREEDWLAEQLEMYRRRSRELADEFEAYRKEVRDSMSAVESQFRAFQHELFRALPVDQRDARLVEWLDSPLPLTNETALAIIQARIADEGKRPEGEVLAALLRLLQKAKGEPQRRVLQIVQTLSAPAVVDAMLNLLDREREPRARHAILAAIGKLDSPKAIPALIREISDDTAPRDCVREAAIALGRIAAKSDARAIEVDAVGPLKRRYASLGPDETGLRAAIVSAMAGLAMPAFAPELLESLDSEDAALLQPALRGLLRLEDTTKLSRFRSLTSHPDPQVRLAAVQGVAELGSEEADLETLLTRLNSGIESSQPVREAAWRGFRDFVDRKPMLERIKAAAGLRETPPLELRYLTELADSLPQSSASPQEAATILDMLATSLASQGKISEAAARWRQLLDAGVPPAEADGLMDSALRWLETAMRAPEIADLKEVLQRIRLLADQSSTQDRVTTTVRRFLESADFRTETERASALLSILRAHGFPEWQDMLDRIAAGLADTPSPEQSP